MEGSRVVLLVILLLFIFFTPDQPARRIRQYDTERIDQQRQLEDDVLTNSTYLAFNPTADAWLNLTGFREDDGYAWDSLAKAQAVSREQYDSNWKGIDATKNLPIYSTVTGEIRGKFTKSDEPRTLPKLNLTAIDPKKDYLSNWFERNVTQQEGELSISLFDAGPRLDSEAAAIKVDLSLYVDDAPGNGWQARLHGVHFPTGAVLVSTSSSKFDSLPAFPHFTQDETSFNSSRPIMNATIQDMREKDFDDGADGLAFAPQCELILWLQPVPFHIPKVDISRSTDLIHRIEKELKQPEGAPIGHPPPITYSAVVFSPDCGYILTSPALLGPKNEAYWTLAQRLIFAFVLSLGLQIMLLKRQMEKAATPSTRSRIAYQSIVIAALGDGLILFALIALLMIDASAFLVVAAAGYLSTIHVAFLEVKFVFDIWTVQVGDPQRAQQQRTQRTVPAATTTAPTIATPVTTISATGGGPPVLTATSVPSAAPVPISADATIGLPLPATAPRPDGATPIILPSDQGAPIPIDTPSPRASFAAIYSRFYFTLVVLMFFSLWATSWPRPLRSAYVNLLVVLYFSFWWPQIYRNTIRNCRKALSWEYVVGSSVLRALPVLYWYFVDHNILAVDTSTSTGLALLAWLWLQVAILVSQNFLGPRLLVRDSWCPPAYDYHPLLREDDVESAGGMSIGLLASASEAKDKDDKTRKVFDCAICMNEIDVPVLSRADMGKNTGTAWLEQRNYMVTPCRHIFHAECLEGWMNLRLVCPVCREGLPPL